MDRKECDSGGTGPISDALQLLWPQYCPCIPFLIVIINIIVVVAFTVVVVVIFVIIIVVVELCKI